VGVQRQIEQEFFPDRNFEAPAEIYVELVRLALPTVNVKSVFLPSDELTEIGLRDNDYHDAETQATEFIVYRVAERAFKKDAVSGSLGCLIGLAQLERNERKSELTVKRDS